ncbi:MAG: DUF2894 domain-containing protein [Rhodoferax sp.]
MPSKSEFDFGARPDSVVDQPVDFSPVLSSLRQAGAGQFEPVDFHYIEALANRVNAQQGRVKRILHAKLVQALMAFSERFKKAQRDAMSAIALAAQSHPQAVVDLQQLFLAGDFRGVRRFVATQMESDKRESWGDLVRCDAQRAPAQFDVRLEVPAGLRSEQKTVQYFRDTWSKLSAAKQVAQALGQAPKNAGPINSHRVVLRSLVLMREISPDYLNRFMSHVNTLLCLDQCDREMQAIAKRETDAAKGKAVNRGRIRSR